jgi:hypothetical protein
LGAALYITQRSTAENFLLHNGYTQTHIVQTRSLTIPEFNKLLADLAHGLGVSDPPSINTTEIVEAAMVAAAITKVTPPDNVIATAGAMEVPYFPLKFTMQGDTIPKQCLTLADSGATFSLVSVRTLKSLWGYKWKDKVQHDDIPQTLKMANGTIQKTHGFVYFTVAHEDTVLHK